MHRHFENWNDMKHEPHYFWSAETTCLNLSDSQMPLLWFFLWGGGSVYRLGSDKSWYFAITEFNNCFIFWSPCISLGSKAICHFHIRSIAWFLLCMSRILFAAKHQSQTQLDDVAREQTIICRQVFAGHVVGSWPMKRKKNLLQMIMIMA